MEGYVKTACTNSESVKEREKEGNSSQRAGSSSCCNELCLYRLSQSGYPPVLGISNEFCKSLVLFFSYLFYSYVCI